MKLTKDIINERINERLVILVGDLKNTSSKALFECLKCQFKWSSFVSNVVHKNRGCPKCAGNMPLTFEVVQKRLVDRDVEFIGEYVNSVTKSKFRCKRCSNIWFARVSAILSGQSCPECNGTSPLTVEMIEKSLIGRDIEFIGPYKNNSSSTKWRCLKCDNVWMTSTGNLLVAKTGCPSCAEYGFNANKPAWAYVFAREKYLKYGITNDLNRRLSEHRKYGDITLIYEQHYHSGKLAVKWEKDIKKLFGGRYVTKEQCPEGWTETLAITLLEDVINHSKIK